MSLRIRPQPRVEVWSTSSPSPAIELLLTPLDSAERARAHHLPPAARAGFVRGRALLRTVVGARLGMSAADVSLSVRCPLCGATDHGPAEVTTTPGLHVSVTRTGPAVAVALCLDGPVGIDVAAHDAVVAAPIAGVALGRRERARLDAAPPAARAAMLAQSWARTEAVLKATRTGLRVDPSTVDVTRHAVRVPGIRGRVRVVNVPLGSPIVGGVAAAVAVHVPARARPLPRRGITVVAHDGDPLLAGLAQA